MGVAEYSMVGPKGHGGAASQHLGRQHRVCVSLSLGRGYRGFHFLWQDPSLLYLQQYKIAISALPRLSLHT